MVARNNLGFVLTGCTSRLHAKSPLVAEALALREDILLASNFNVSRVVLESDLRNLIDSCRREKRFGEIELIIRDIVQMKEIFTSYEFLWTNRRRNRVADCLAHLAASNTLPLN